MTAAAVSLLVAVPGGASANTQTVDSYPVSSGVTYTHYTHSGSNHINHVSVDLNDPYTKLDIGVPSPIAKRDATTTLANRDTRDGNRVVGAVNASFFDMNSGLPMYLISQGNEIVNGGVISSSREYYVRKPIAFGVMNDGRSEIDDFHFDVRIDHQCTSYQITGLTP